MINYNHLHYFHVAATEGSVSVSSDPAGAAVYVDGVNQGNLTFSSKTNYGAYLTPKALAVHGLDIGAMNSDCRPSEAGATAAVDASHSPAATVAR